jgi:hypothetical protein
MANGPLTVNITDFTSQQITTDLKSKPLGGVPIFAYIPDGWSGSFKVDRQSQVIDAYFAALEAAYYNGQGLAAGTIYETIKEPDTGATSQWTYTGVVMALSSPGDYSADKKVEQTVKFMASQKTQVA